MKLLNFWGGLQPDIWGKTDEYYRMGQDKFFRITQKFINATLTSGFNTQ